MRAKVIMLGTVHIVSLEEGGRLMVVFEGSDPSLANDPSSFNLASGLTACGGTCRYWLLLGKKDVCR
jgi:hypothetical protein